MNVKLDRIVRTVQKHRHLLLICITSTTVVAVLYAVCKRDVWTATQGLVIRDEIAGHRLGRFESTDAMQTAQETILEIASYPMVVEGALRDVGPLKKRHAKNWPTTADIDDLVKAISVTAPNGAQFGRTEMIYLTVKSSDPQRAAQLASAVCDHLEQRLKFLRNEKYQSITDELTKNVNLARVNLDEATARIETIEKTVGADLVELRDLSNNSGGQSHLARSLNEIKNELRQVKAVHTAQTNQHQLLVMASKDARQLIATPNQLLESQPALRRLKEGLVDAQLRTAQLLGVMKKDHPDAKAAIVAEEHVRQQLHDELDLALRGLQVDMEVSTRRIAHLEKQAADAGDRLAELAQIRARYSNLAAEVDNKAQYLEKVERDLSEARANQRASEAVSLITRVENPVTSTHPLGPGGKMIVLAGVLGGILLGLGVVFLVEPMAGLSDTRWSNYLSHGRRNTDRPGQAARETVGGRRASDMSGRSTNETSGRRVNDRSAEGGPPKRRASDLDADLSGIGGNASKLCHGPRQPELRSN